MKKINFIIIATILFFNLINCAGYKPIYSSSNINFKIESHSLKGDKTLANLIYKKLYNSTFSNRDNLDAKSISLSIETNKVKKPTVKNSAGKILEYEINLNTNITINDYLTDKIILNKNFNYSIGYKIQDAHSQTRELENKNIQDLVDKTYQDILIKISETISLP